MTVNVERIWAKNSSGINIQDEVETLIKHYRKKIVCLRNMTKEFQTLLVLKNHYVKAF